MTELPKKKFLSLEFGPLVIGIYLEIGIWSLSLHSVKWGAFSNAIPWPVRRHGLP